MGNVCDCQEDEPSLQTRPPVVTRGQLYIKVTHWMNDYWEKSMFTLKGKRQAPLNCSCHDGQWLTRHIPQWLTLLTQQPMQISEWIE